MKQAVLLGVVSLLLLQVSPAYGIEDSPPQASFTPHDSGFTLTVTGIDAVEAIATAASGAVQGTAIVDQGLIGNLVEEHDVSRHVLIQDSFRDNRGIVSVNQEAGNLNNQANVRVLTFVEGGSLVQDLELWGASQRVGNTLNTSGGVREDRMVNSFGGTVGIAGANQSAGSLNQQANVLVLGIGVALGPEVMALGDSTLGDISADNTLEGPGGPRTDVIIDSFTGFRGIAQVNQSAGDLNVVRNFLGLSLTVMSVP